MVPRREVAWVWPGANPLFGSSGSGFIKLSIGYAIDYGLLILTLRISLLPISEMPYSPVFLTIHQSKPCTKDSNSPIQSNARKPKYPIHYSSSTSRCRPRTFFLNSSASLSHSSAASPFRGEALYKCQCHVATKSSGCLGLCLLVGLAEQALQT